MCRHLHPLLDMRLEAPGMRRMKMGTRWEEKLSSEDTTSSSDSLAEEQALPSGTPSSAGTGVCLSQGVSKVSWFSAPSLPRRGLCSITMLYKWSCPFGA